MPRRGGRPTSCARSTGGRPWSWSSTTWTSSTSWRPPSPCSIAAPSSRKGAWTRFATTQPSATSIWGSARMLEADGVHAGYGGVPVLSGVSLRVAAGERVVIIGRNGGGKTALLRALMGFLHCRQGRIRLLEQDITRLAPHARARLGIGYVPQGREIFPGLTVRENLTMGAIGRPGASSRVAELLEVFPRLGERLDQRGGSPSGGGQPIPAVARTP